MTRHSRPTFPVSNDSRAALPTEEGGYGWEYVPRAVKPGTPVRQPVPIEPEDIERQPMKFIALALMQLHRQFRRMAISIEDRSQAVDEYQSQTPTGPVTNLLQLQPQYESNERITSILVVGPAGAATVTLGDRVLPLTIPASGFLILAPVSFFLGRDDLRQLSTATAGQINLILGGYADTRGVGP